jgi:superfamily II DNA or RNA helicase
MWLDVTTTTVRVTRMEPREETWITDFLSVSDPKSRFRTGGMIEKLRLFNRFNNSFPAGLFPLVRKGAIAEGFQVDVFDNRGPAVAVDPDADVAWLRDYQRAALDTIVAKERGILRMTTGSGKTEVAIALTRVLPCRWLFLVHRASLMDQAASRYELRTGLGAGRIGEGAFDVPRDTRFVSATLQSIAAGLKSKDSRVRQLLDGAQGLVVDEVHSAAADTYFYIIQQCAARYRVGLSGTPLDRDDNKDIFTVAALGPIVYRVAAEVLIQAGVLARPHIMLARCEEKSDKPTWQGVYGESVVRSKRRNSIVVQCAKRAETPCLLFVKEISHGRALVKLLEKQGIPSAFVYGNEPLENRKRAIRDVVAGRTQVLVCSVIFQEGQDIPELRSVVVASGGKSTIAALQRIGRGMRVSKGKDTFDVYDIADIGCGCVAAAKRGEPEHTGCKWLDKHTRERLKAYVAEGHATSFLDVHVPST